MTLQSYERVGKQQRMIVIGPVKLLTKLFSSEYILNIYIRKAYLPNQCEVTFSFKYIMAFGGLNVV